ncbi:ParB N-terminal domain-containing protein [Gallibacterium anatis]|uniref:ParB N-terminal domain-containing protein n=1 Tax=Gallibacterium anatis TaxID=750 RepID=UPI00068BC7D3|nr:ParB N-terminal domain-containing protein [Gallibacterium anatis]
MRKTLSITRLYLDSKNPRHIPIENQKEIIAFLIENEKIKPLAKDIAEKGLINPLDLVGITEENKKKIVLEGNRRICALKLLLNPLLVVIH